MDHTQITTETPKMASIRQFKGKWQVQIRLKGIKPIVRSFDSQADAEQWATKEEKRLKRARQFAPTEILAASPSQKCSTTLEELIDRYLKEVTSQRATEGAIDRETIRWRVIKRQPVCKKKIGNLSTIDFNEYVNSRLSVVKRVTIRKELNLLRNAFKIGAKRWKLPTRIEWIDELEFKATSITRQRRLVGDEYTKIMNACDKIVMKHNTTLTPRILKLIIDTAILTSERRGELLKRKEGNRLVGFKWSHIYWDENYIHVPETKTQRKRDIPLLSELKKRLQEFYPERIDDEFVFPIEAEALKSAWSRLKKRAGIENLRFHDMRHEALSRLSDMGLTSSQLQLFSGHKSLAMLEIYTHPSRKQALAIIESRQKSSP